MLTKTTPTVTFYSHVSNFMNFPFISFNLYIFTSKIYSKPDIKKDWTASYKLCILSFLAVGPKLQIDSISSEEYTESPNVLIGTQNKSFGSSKIIISQSFNNNLIIDIFLSFPTRYICEIFIYNKFFNLLPLTK